MGGLGSGGWNLRHAGTVEANRRLCADMLRKRGCLTDGFEGEVQWTTDDGETNWIKIGFKDDALNLRYRYRINGGPWQPVVQVICLSSLPCHYGGERTLFLCPSCGTRRKYLYGAGAQFLCRKCHDLTYSCQRERSCDRASRRARKLRRQLGTPLQFGDGVGLKPKGMHKTTFERIETEIESCEHQVAAKMFEYMKRLETPIRRPSKQRGYW